MSRAWRQVKFSEVPGGGKSAPSAHNGKKDEPEAGLGQAVLVVDDQEEVLSITAELIALLGYRVLKAGSGKEALELLGTGQAVDILFTDIVMPGMDGVTLGEEALKLVPRMKVVLVSAFASDQMERVAAGSFPFLRKPYTVKELLKAFGRLD